jgi:hypothetical protein
MRTIRTIVLWLVVCAVASAQGAVRYVSSFSGSDAGNGSNPSAPCKTIQRAVDSSAGGDQIHIATYDVAGFPIPVSNTCSCVGTNAAVIILPAASRSR